MIVPERIRSPLAGWVAVEASVTALSQILFDDPTLRAHAQPLSKSFDRKTLLAVHAGTLAPVLLIPAATLGNSSALEALLVFRLRRASCSATRLEDSTEPTLDAVSLQSFVVSQRDGECCGEVYVQVQDAPLSCVQERTDYQNARSSTQALFRLTVPVGSFMPESHKIFVVENIELYRLTSSFHVLGNKIFRGSITHQRCIEIVIAEEVEMDSPLHGDNVAFRINLGDISLPVGDALKLRPGSIIEMPDGAKFDALLECRGQPFAHATVTCQEGKLFVEIMENYQLSIAAETLSTNIR